MEILNYIYNNSTYDVDQVELIYNQLIIVHVKGHLLRNNIKERIKTRTSLIITQKLQLEVLDWHLYSAFVSIRVKCIPYQFHISGSTQLFSIDRTSDKYM